MRSRKLRVYAAVGVVMVLFWSAAAVAATVTLVDGTRRTGQVVVRSDVVTIIVPKPHSGERLFQYPLHRVKSIRGGAENPSIINRRTALRKSASRSAEPLFELEKGLEVRRLAVRRGWVQVEGWNEEVTGFVQAGELSSEVEFSSLEQSEARKRLEYEEPPPPSRSAASTRPRSATAGLEPFTGTIESVTEEELGE
jgi:hypothetical protein